MTRRVRIIGAASGVGAQDSGCARGPEALRQCHCFRALMHHPQLDWEESLYPRTAHLSVEGPLGQVIDLCSRLCEDVYQTLRRGDLPLVVGGDHSCAIGVWSGVKRYLGREREMGLLWFDAHLDSHTKHTSYSGALHGMPLACLLGVGDTRLTGLGVAGPKVSPKRVAVFGARSFEPEEADLLGRLGVRVFTRGEIEQRGMVRCLEEALAIASQGTDGFGISIDLDVFDPSQAPGVGSPEPEGLEPRHLLFALAHLRGDPRLLGVEISEYNPDRDKNQRTAALAAKIVAALLPGDVASGDVKLPPRRGAVPAT